MYVTAPRLVQWHLWRSSARECNELARVLNVTVILDETFAVFKDGAAEESQLLRPRSQSHDLKAL